MKVLMVCSGGMSSALVVDKVKEEAEKDGLSLDMVAVGTTEFENELKNYDLGLVAPQVKHRFSKLQKVGEEVDIPVALIEPMNYTPMGGRKILNQIKSHISE